MVAKLCISENGNYYLVHKDKSAYEPGFMIGSSFDRLYENDDIYKLSLKNCQAIENGYDLEEISSSLRKEFEIKYNTGKGIPVEGGGYIIRGLDYQVGVIDGFQKAIELLSDKKFSEDDMKKSFILGCEKRLTHPYHVEIETKPLLQQTEWIVEIEMVPYHDGNFVDDGHTHIIEVKSRPALDDDGCIILKRI